MKQIIKEVMQAEEQVSEILKQARSKASKIKSSTEKDISEKRVQAKEQAHKIIQAAVEDAQKQAQDIRQDKLKQTYHDKDTVLNDNADKIDGLIENICNMILSTEYERNSE